MHEESLFESTLQSRAVHFLDVLLFVWQHTHTHTRLQHRKSIWYIAAVIYFDEIYIAFAIS